MVPCVRHRRVDCYASDVGNCQPIISTDSRQDGGLIMSGPVQPPFAVQTTTKTTVVRPTSTLSLNADQFTVTNSGSRVATVSIIDGGGGIGGSITEGQVAFGAATADEIEGSSKLTWDDTAGSEVLAISGTNNTMLTVTSTDTNAGIKVDTPNDGYAVVFFAEGGTNKWSAGKLSGANDDFTIYNEVNNNPVIRITSSDAFTFNPDNIATADFGVKGDNDTILFADSSQDNLGVGTDSPSSDVERVHIKGTGASATDPLVRLEVAEDGALSGPIIDLYRNSATPENSDNMGEIFFRGNHAATSGAASAGSETYGRIRMDAVSVVTSSENSILLFDVVMGGTLTEFMRLNASAGAGYIVFNETSKDIDVRMESEGNSEMFKLDAELDYIGIGASPVANDGVLQVTSDEEIVMSITSTSSTGATLVMDAQGTGGEEWRLVSGADSAGIGAGNFGLYNKGTANAYIWTAGEDGVVGIGAFPGTDAERLHVKGDGQTAPMVLIESEDDPGISGANPTLRLYNSSTPGMNLQGGKLEFSAKNDAGSEFVYGSIGMTIRDSTANEDGSIEIRVAQAGTESTVEYMRIGTATQRVFINPGTGNIDTQISSENVAAMLMVNAGLDMVGVGADPSSGGAQLQVDEDASFLLPVAAYTANHDITAAQAHGYALQMKTGSGTGTFTLPETGVIGMQVTCVNFGAGMNVAVDSSSSHKINGGGSAGNSTTATVTAACARYALVYIAAATWNWTAPAVVTAS